MEFGEDQLIIESYKIPWLIWIQLFIMILLILLLFFGFTAFTDPDTAAAITAAPPSNELNAVAPPTHLNNPVTSSNEITKVEDQRVRMDTGTSRESIREEDHSRGEELALKDPMLLRNSQHPNHPCTYIRLAKRAFLKCLGLDYSSERSNSQHEKQE